MDSKINNFQGFLFERKKDKKSKKSTNDSSTEDVSKPKELLDELDINSDKMKLILNPIIECISGSIQCIVSINDLSITQTDNGDIEKLKKDFQTIKNNIENFLSNKKITKNLEFIESIKGIKNLLKEKNKIDKSIMTKEDFINIKEKSLKNKSGEALESSIYSILKESFGLYQDAIKNYINSLDEYLKIYIIKTSQK